MILQDDKRFEELLEECN